MARIAFRPEVRELLLAGLREHGIVSEAVRGAGISSTQFYEWLNRGERGEPGYAEFRSAAIAATAEGAKRRLGISPSVAC